MQRERETDREGEPLVRAESTAEPLRRTTLGGELVPPRAAVPRTAPGGGLNAAPASYPEESERGREREREREQEQATEMQEALCKGSVKQFLREQ